MDWTTPEDVRNQLARYWSNGRILTGFLRNTSLFPLSLLTKKPGPADLSDRFEEVRQWIRVLEAGSKHQVGYGYEIEWSVKNNRHLGTNKVPARLVVATEADALALLNRTAEFQSFQMLATATLERFPILKTWLIRHPLIALAHADDWGLILDVLAWFCANPNSGLYLRQVEVRGVHTKFVEDRKGLILTLLDAVSDPACSDDRSEVGSLEQRCGLRHKPALIRFRLLDEKLYIQGLSDIALQSPDFARLGLGASISTAFITENEINGLSFPSMPRSIVIFGLGYGLERLAAAAWLASKQLFYWGDIDTHGFVMLDRLRSIFPRTKSFLMDRENLMLHQTSWANETDPYGGRLSRLTTAEQALFEDLQRNSLGAGVRLEQERIPISRVVLALQDLRSAGELT